MIVDVAYPAPLVHVPKGKRRESVGFAAMRTFANLRETSLKDFEVVHRPEGPTQTPQTLHAFDGALWRQAGEHGSMGASAAVLLHYLAVNTPAPGYSILRDHFTRTPLVGCALQGIPSRGDLSPEQSRRIDLDGRASAEARIRGFVESSIVLAEGQAFLRCRPLLTPGLGKKAVKTSQHMQLSPGNWRAQAVPEWPSPESGSPFQEYAFRLDRAADMRGFVLAKAPQYRQDPFVSAVRPCPVPVELLGDEDIAFMANVLPEYVLARMSSLRSDVGLLHPNDRARDEAFGRAMDGLRLWALEGTVGGVPAEDYERAIEASASAASLTLATISYPEVGHRLRQVVDYVATIARPRFAEMRAETPAADLEDLQRLMP